MRYDCVLIHAPKHIHESIPFGRCMSITRMPMGLLALADVLDRNDISCQVVHLGVETTGPDGFNLDDYLCRNDVRAVGISLQWHQQAYDSISLAEKVKELEPSMPVFMGGITASYFGEQILSEHGAVDYIVRGEAYDGTVGLMRHVLNHNVDLESVPNIIYRRHDGTIACSATRTAASARRYDDLRFGRLELVRNYQRYLRMPWLWLTSMPQLENEKEPLLFPLFTGQGCESACSYCGGGSETYQRLFGSGGSAYCSSMGVLRTMREAADHGVSNFHICYNPKQDRDDAYYTDLFEAIARWRQGIDMTFECWALPSKVFVEAFRRSFHHGSTVTISPDTGSERLRAALTDKTFTNAQLMDSLSCICDEGVNVVLFFTDRIAV